MGILLIPEAIFYLLKGDYTLNWVRQGCRAIQESHVASFGNYNLVFSLMAVYDLGLRSRTCAMRVGVFQIVLTPFHLMASHEPLCPTFNTQAHALNFKEHAHGHNIVVFVA